MFITVAPTGAEVTKNQNPNLPTQPNEIADQAVACATAGAAMIHIHGRDLNDKSTLEHAVLKDIMQQVRERTDLVIQLSTGGSVKDSYSDRIKVLELEPESCSLTLGTVNFGDEIFYNPYPFIKDLYKESIEKGVVPEFECFELGHIQTLHRLLDDLGEPATGAIHCNFVMGVPGAMPASPDIIRVARDMLPVGATWSSTGIGRAHVPVMLTTMALGGNLRVGMEDVVKYSANELVTGNEQLVERAALLAGLASEPLQTPAELREVFKLT